MNAFQALLINILRDDKEKRDIKDLTKPLLYQTEIRKVSRNFNRKGEDRNELSRFI